MIFVSYNHGDAGLVSEFAQRLTAKVSKDTVFFDEWSIEPGDGIIDRMNWGLENTKYFVFLLSQNSITSKMVALEWQNALMRSTKGQCRFIPVKLDDVQLPAILTQVRYINLFQNGVAVAVDELVAIVSGRREEAIAKVGVHENVVCEAQRTAGYIDLSFKALTYFEPLCEFGLLLENSKEDFAVGALDQPGWRHTELGYQNLNAQVRLFAVCIGSMFGGLTPRVPFRVRVTAKNGAELRINCVTHKKSETKYDTIPLTYLT